MENAVGDGWIRGRLSGGSCFVARSDDADCVVPHDAITNGGGGVEGKDTKEGLLDKKPPVGHHCVDCVVDDGAVLHEFETAMNDVRTGGIVARFNRIVVYEAVDQFRTTAPGTNESGPGCAGSESPLGTVVAEDAVANGRGTINHFKECGPPPVAAFIFVAVKESESLDKRASAFPVF